MDVFGRAPTSEVGAYFRRTVWGWHPLADIVCALAPKITAGCLHWHTNDGDGLDATASGILGRTLRSALRSGKAARRIAERQARIDALPDETCTLCKGTGIRTDELGREHGQPQRLISLETGAEPDHPRLGQTGWCNGCDGRGATPAFLKHYRCDAGDIAEFADFLEACGGFEIC
jgi:hypothetical protein